MLYQQTMKLRHAKNRLDAARKREAAAARLYGKRVRMVKTAPGYPQRRD